MNKYAIVCGSRSGSTYLCKLLSSTNRCGKPQEFWNNTLISKFYKELQLNQPSCHEYNDKIIKKYSTTNQVFGIKVVGMDQWSRFENCGMTVNNYVWLKREDDILQAISRYIAFTTNAWHGPTIYPPYSKEGIKWCLDEIRRENEFYTEYFKNKKHIYVSYEDDLCAAPEQTVIYILNKFKITVEELPGISSNIKATSKINLEWKNKFLNEKI